MTDQTIPADKVRDLRDQYARLIVDAGTKEAQAYYGHVVKDLDALLPAPKPPTLAGMTAGERVACKWMQADTEQQGRTVIISPNASVGRALMIDQEANLLYVARDEVTPRPDLPRMEWPDTEKAAPAPAPALPEGWRLADHKDLGRGIVTNPTPNHDGHVYFVLPDDEDHRGYGEGWCDPEELTYIDQEADTPDTVPPNTLAEGSEWDDTDAPARACRESGRDQIVALDNSGAAAPTLANMVAGMREEWGVAVTYPGLAEVVEWGFGTQAGALEEVAVASTMFGAESRIVRRYVTEPEEA